ncbi:hypothetical protein [Flavobacterium sp.]|uniref:hypothetical protein n=1 Tax=Flavobacterium sp. TaxID=239 RepID=UPI00374D2CE0
MNYTVIIILGIFALGLVLFTIIRNLKDKMNLEQKMNNDYPKTIDEKGDIDEEEDL